MKPRLVWSALLAFVLAAGLMAWLTLGAQSAIANAPTPAINRYVAPPPLGNNSLNDCASISTPCATIGYAITQSASGNQINVASGWYTEHITMTNGVSIYGAGWDTNTGTVITGNFSAAQPVVTFPSGIDATTVLSGVQVTGGGNHDIFAALNGGGISMTNSSPTIVNTWLFSNTAQLGGGVYVNGGSPTFNNVSAWSNYAYNGGGFYLINSPQLTITSDFAGNNGTVWWNSSYMDGGGFYLYGITATLSGLRIWGNTRSGVWISSSGSPSHIRLWLNDIWYNSGPIAGGIFAGNITDLDITGNLIRQNSATWLNGGGVSLQNSAGLFQYNFVLSNTATGPGGGVEVCCATSGLKLFANWIEGNSAATNGGGLYLWSDAAPLIDSNTIVSNTATYEGGGIHLYQAGSVTITNNIVAHNSSIGAGVQITASPARIVNNTIANNNGSGITFGQSEGIVIVNNILSGNTGYGLEQSPQFSTTLLTEDYNDFFGNGGQYGGLTLGANDKFENPLFVGSGDMFRYYHLQATSPVSKTGSLTWPPAKDIDGELRTSYVSMGADQILIRLFLPLIKK